MYDAHLEGAQVWHVLTRKYYTVLPATDMFNPQVE